MTADSRLSCGPVGVIGAWPQARGLCANVDGNQFAADSWLGAAITPDEAGAAITQIARSASDAGRAVDPEHYALSIQYAAIDPDPDTVAAIRARRPNGAIEQVFPIGPVQLRDLVGRLVDQGLSKFVVRPVGTPSSWRDDLNRLADTLLDLQT